MVDVSVGSVVGRVVIENIDSAVATLSSVVYSVM